MGEALAGFRTEPNPAVSTAGKAETGADFKAADRQAGWLVVNKWTYRILRAVVSKTLPKIDETGIDISDVTQGGRAMKVVRPENQTGAGAVLLLHGGGFVLGSASETLVIASMLARACGVPVFSPSYRLAPEHPFPAGLDDCHSAWSWLAEHASEYGVDGSKIVVAGISAGGGQAASLIQRLHDEGGVQPSGQLLIYPMLDDRTAARRSIDKPRHRVWSNANNHFGWSSYLGQEPGGADCPTYASPARREDLAGLPPAWIGVGGADLFLDEDREYASRLRQAGVDVAYVEIDGGIHGFDLAAESPLTQAFHASAAEFATTHTS